MQPQQPKTEANLFELSSSHLLTDMEAAAHLQVSPGTLSVWRCEGRYNLPFIKIGRKVRYRAGELRSFLEKRTRTQTS